MVWGLHSIAPHPATVDFCCLRLQCSFGGLLPAVPTLQSDGFIGIFYNKHAEEPYALTSIFFSFIVGAKIGGHQFRVYTLPIWLGFFSSHFSWQSPSGKVPQIREVTTVPEGHRVASRNSSKVRGGVKTPWMDKILCFRPFLGSN